MPTIDHDRDCVCGQALDLVVTSTSLHCPRCGRTIATACPSESERSNWVSTPALAGAAA